MIPQAYITEWHQQVPWSSPAQVEQDLVICRALIALFSDEWLKSKIAFRGGTALHKLYLQPQPRYSEDIDLVQLSPEPIKEIIQKIQSVMSFLGDSKVVRKRNGFQIIYRFESEFPPIVNLRLKIETNTREHFSATGALAFPFEVQSSWFSGRCELNTYSLEELLGTKLRALYQRKKGRDLFDLYTALIQRPDLNIEELLDNYHLYMQKTTESPPSQKEFILNMEEKMKDSDFLGDTTALLRPSIEYQAEEAFELVKIKLIENI